MIKKILLVLLAIIISIILIVQYSAYRINNKPGAYNYDDLMKPLVGTETIIQCPDGTKIYTISGGEGPLVILAHGLGGTLDSWKVVYDSLINRGYRVVAFDQRGHGKSTTGKRGINSDAMAEDYKHILAYLKAEKAVLVGHSMGGFLAIKYMISHPESASKHLKSSLLLSTFAGDVSRDNPQNNIQIPLIRSGAIKTIMNRNALSTLFQSALVAEPYGGLIQTAIAQSKRQDIMTLIPIISAFVVENHYPELSKINIPCIVAVGDKDQTTPAFHSELLAKGIRESKFVKIPNTAHLVNWEKPNVIVDLVQKAHQ